MGVSPLSIETIKSLFSCREKEGEQGKAGAGAGASHARSNKMLLARAACMFCDERPLWLQRRAQSHGMGTEKKHEMVTGSLILPATYIYIYMYILARYMEVVDHWTVGKTHA